MLNVKNVENKITHKTISKYDYTKTNPKKKKIDQTAKQYSSIYYSKHYSRLQCFFLWGYKILILFS